MQFEMVRLFVVELHLYLDVEELWRSYPYNIDLIALSNWSLYP